MLLPDKGGWQVAKSKSRFAEIRHPATASTLVVRTWLESEVMSAARCEKKARLWREFPESNRAIVRARVNRPRGFDTRFALGTVYPRILNHSSRRSSGENMVIGYVLAFGSKLDRCFAFAYTTKLASASSERPMAERLMYVRRKVLNSVRLDRSTEVVRQPR